MNQKQTTNSRSPDWVRDAIFYQIFPERFANGDPQLNPADTQPWGAPPTRTNFFGGDLVGVKSNLDHLKELGCDAIYFTPIFTANTNHRYDATDYYKVDPALGGDQAFTKMLEAAHNKDIRIILDAVFHHCGDHHPAFQDVVQNEEKSKYINWFSVAEFPVEPFPEPNYLTCSGCHYLPKLNVYNPEVRNYLFGAVEKWTKMGIDGWRLDVPYMMENPHFWRQFRKLVKSIDADSYIVAEVWERATNWVQGNTSDAAMNYRVRDAVLGFVTDWRNDAQWLAAQYERIDEEIPAHAKGLMLNLLGSHDTERVFTKCGTDVPATRLAYSLLFATEGAPMIYYGDEIGMQGFNDPDCRRCMNWDRDDWNYDIYNWLKTLITMRKNNIALRRGSETTLYARDDQIIRARQHNEQTVLIYVNRSNAPRTLHTPNFGGRAGIDLVDGTKIELDAVEVLAMEARFVKVN